MDEYRAAQLAAFILQLPEKRLDQLAALMMAVLEGSSWMRG